MKKDKRKVYKHCLLISSLLVFFCLPVFLSAGNDSIFATEFEKTNRDELKVNNEELSDLNAYDSYGSTMEPVIDNATDGTSSTDTNQQDLPKDSNFDLGETKFLQGVDQNTDNLPKRLTGLGFLRSAYKQANSTQDDDLKIKKVDLTFSRLSHPKTTLEKLFNLPYDEGGLRFIHPLTDLLHGDGATKETHYLDKEQFNEICENARNIVEHYVQFELTGADANTPEVDFINKKLKVLSLILNDKQVLYLEKLFKWATRDREELRKYIANQDNIRERSFSIDSYINNMYVEKGDDDSFGAKISSFDHNETTYIKYSELISKTEGDVFMKAFSDFYKYIMENHQKSDEIKISAFLQACEVDMSQSELAKYTFEDILIAYHKKYDFLPSRQIPYYFDDTTCHEKPSEKYSSLTEDDTNCSEAIIYDYELQIQMSDYPLFEDNLSF